MDALEEMKKALAEYMKIRNTPDWAECSATHRLVGLNEELLPALLAELEARRAAMGEEWVSPQGFTPSATRAMR